MNRVFRAALALALASGCRTADPPATQPGTPAIATPAGPAPPDAAAAVAIGRPTAAGWVRAPKPEPDPVALALYRRAVDQAAANQPVEARALLDRLRSEHPASRFARRVRAPGDPAGTAALMGLAASLLVPLLAESEAISRPPGTRHAPP
ncbi:MAG: hypothetical protein KC620_15115 [Myxococcales bacterium]|nr:hypothetical protein [Myxococcales bacterium]